MVGRIWNHGPDMWESMRTTGVAFPVFTEDEMSDLMTYLYFSSFVDPPGDIEKGSELFAEKGCLSCHWGGDTEKGAIGQAVSKMKVATVPEVIAAMWNHASDMEKATRAADVVWPQIRPGEMGDLVAFIRSRSKAAAQE